MKFTKFYHEGCDTTFHVKYAIEQHVKDIEFCPSCGGYGKFTKEGVTELNGLLVTVSDIKETG